MDRRQFIGSGLCAGAIAALPPPARAAGPDPAKTLYDRIVADSLRASPQFATLLGLDAGSLKGRLDARGEDNRLGQLTPFLEAGPSLNGLPRAMDVRARQWMRTVAWYADATHRMSRVPHLTVAGYGYPLPYPISQLTGAYCEVPDLLASQHTIANVADCDAYIARLDQFGRALDQDTAMSAANATASFVPPDFICDRALTQIDSLIASRGTNAGLVRALADGARKAGVAGDWEGRATTLVEGPIAASLARQKAHLQDLRRRAMTSAGLRERPGGGTFYEVALRFHTTVDDTPEQVHRLGLEHVAATKAEVDALLTQLGHRGGTVAERLKVLATDPAQLFPSDDSGRAALLAYVRERTEDVKRRLPAAFSRVPKAPMAIRRVPVETELGAPSAYSLPGVIYFNLSSTANWPKWQLPTVIYHEGYPGHHFQTELLNETAGLPQLFKLFCPNAFNEGGALYAELVADELGVYDAEPVGRLGRLKDDLFRSCRLVVDTGLHSQGWSREQAIAYLIEEGGQTDDNARREVERYVVWPGQACSYKMGQLEILRQRGQAKARLGERFSMKSFHDALLLGGGMPLSIVGEVVTEAMVR